jgi:hypothetical protein
MPMHKSQPRATFLGSIPGAADEAVLYSAHNFFKTNPPLKITADEVIEKICKEDQTKLT